MNIEDSKVFLDYLSYGEELYFVYNNNKYFFRGYTKGETVFREVWNYDNMEEDFVWSYCGDYEKALPSFLSSPIFNGKVFYEAFSEIKWCESFA